MISIKVFEEKIEFVGPERLDTFFLGAFHIRCPMTLAVTGFPGRKACSTVGACCVFMTLYQ
jgi:hypothetical protein